MKTKEQALDWIGSQEWYGKFIKNARNEHDWRLSEFFHWLSNQVYVANIIIDAFNWSSQDEGLEFWRNANSKFLQWLNSDELTEQSSEDEQPSEDEQTEQSSRSVQSSDRWIFDRGSKEAPFYMVYAEGKSAPTFKHGSMEEATKEADRLAKSLNTKTYVLAAVMEIRPEVVTSAVGIDDMEHQEDNPF